MNNMITELTTTKSKENQVQDLKFINLFKSDKNNFKFIYNKYFNYIKHYISSRFVYNENVDDYTIEILTKVYERLETYNYEFSNFSTWITKIANNYMIDNRRSKKRFEYQNIDDIKTVLDCEKNSSCYDRFHHENNLSALITKENNKILLNVLNVAFSDENKTDVKLKSMIKMLYYEQLNYNEILALTNESLGTIKCSLFRAKDRIRRHIIKNGIDLR